MNSHIKNSHNLNFAKTKINPRRKAQDERNIYERQRQRLERKKNEVHNPIQASVLQAKVQEASQRALEENTKKNKKWGKAKHNKADKTLQSKCAL